MATVNALRNVVPIALTLCKQGANRQRIFLRKSAVAEADLLTLPGGEMKILKQGADWTTFYCVVAEPGAEEDPGLVGDQDSVDVWESDEEIRKAAHELLKQGAFVNLAHDGPAEPGCAIVESAVALADIDVDGTVIKKGSWYVGIEPTADLRKSIEDGEIEAISLEGSGVRVPIEKAATFGEVIGAKQLRDALWSATSTLEDVIYAALRDEDEAAPKDVIRTSLDQFVDYLAPMLDAVTGEGRAALAKELGTVTSTTRIADQEAQMGLAEDIAALKKSHEDATEAITDKLKKSDETTGQLIGLVGKLTERVEALASGAKQKEAEPVAKSQDDAVKLLGDLADKLDSFDSDLTGLAKAVAALGEGGSSQDDKSDEIRKATKDNPLAGLLS
jgi:hypothetical protein